MSYVDGFVAAVPKANKEAFRKQALAIDTLYTKHGATQVIEAWGVDVTTGTTTDFFKAVKAKEDETILFSWVLWPDKATRDAGVEKVVAEMEAMDEADTEILFDGKRLIHGGFEVLVELSP